MTKRTHARRWWMEIDKPVDTNRRDFLRLIGGTATTLVGVFGLTRAFDKQAHTGYGSSPYGGGKG